MTPTVQEVRQGRDVGPGPPPRAPAADVGRRTAAAPDVGSPVRSTGDGCVIGRSESRELYEVRAASGCPLCGRGRLNAQEATIARMLVEGMDERRVAAELFIGAVALRAHLARICAKLDIPSPADLVLVIGRGTSLDFDPGRADGVGGCREREPVDRTRLTQQEDAVVRLMRQGLDERQVAAELFIGLGAVESHLAHIRAKSIIEGSPATDGSRWSGPAPSGADSDHAAPT